MTQDKKISPERLAQLRAHLDDGHGFTNTGCRSIIEELVEGLEATLPPKPKPDYEIVYQRGIEANAYLHRHLILQNSNGQYIAEAGNIFDAQRIIKALRIAKLAADCPSDTYVIKFNMPGEAHLVLEWRGITPKQAEDLRTLFQEKPSIFDKGSDWPGEPGVYHTPDPPLPGPRMPSLTDCATILTRWMNGYDHGCQRWDLLSLAGKDMYRAQAKALLEFLKVPYVT